MKLSTPIPYGKKLSTNSAAQVSGAYQHRVKAPKIRYRITNHHIGQAKKNKEKESRQRSEDFLHKRQDLSSNSVSTFLKGA